MELHGPEQEALLRPQSGADVFTHGSQLAALWPDGVLGIVGIFYQSVAFTGQGQSTVQYVLLKVSEDQWLTTKQAACPPPNIFFPLKWSFYHLLQGGVGQEV